MKIKIVALALAILGLAVAVYGVGKLSDYRKVDRAWASAADQRNDVLRRSRTPSGGVDDRAATEIDRLRRVSDQLGDARDDLRARCQRLVQLALLPVALGLVLGIIGLVRRPRGWMPVASTLCAVTGGGMIGMMLSAGVF